MKPAVIYARVSSKDQEREGYSIPAQQFQLRRDGVAFAFLILAGNAGVDDGWFHAASRSRDVLPTMRSRRFCVNCDFAFLGRIPPPGRAILYGTIPFVEQQDHLAQRAEVCAIEVFSPCGPLHFFG